MDDLEQELQEQRHAAEQRLAERADERAENVEKLSRPGGIAEVDTPDRIAKRLDRLTRYYAGEDLPTAPADTPSAETSEVLAAAIARAPEEVVAPATAGEAAAVAEEVAGAVLERIINTEDFVDIRYLEAGVAAARAVCRVNIRNQAGKLVGYGTGSLVSPRLLLTNHHVLPSAAVAAVSTAEFNYQDGLDGQPLQPKVFRLDPQTFFLNNKERDFALVAMRAAAPALAPFGFNPLIEAEGKAVIGEFVTIVQHPGGEKKQVALRENRIVDLPGSFMHYETDTEPGSSGSPVFNDQWEVVALHHASVPAQNHPEFGGFLNEGIRVSRILKFVRQNASGALVNQLFQPERIEIPLEVPSEDGSAPAPAEVPAPAAPLATDDGAVRLTVPLEITVRLGGSQAPPAEAPVEDGDVAEAIEIDPNYASRRGYDPAFLGEGAHRVPLPRLPDDLYARTSKKADAAGGGRHVLPYHHYSVVMNRQRRLAFFTAVNINGRLSRRLTRERDKWALDPRIPAGEQTGEAVYRDNPLDRGHLVRRLDPAWGQTLFYAKRANDDTFHFTNCTPQHEDFNQNKTTWAGLEDYILENADNRDLRVSVFTGPVLAGDDDQYRGVQLPRQFWKVVVMVKRNGDLSATAYLLSQQRLIAGLETAEAFSYGAYRTFQVPVRRVEELTRVSFGALAAADPLAGLEATTEAREVASPADIVL